MNVKKFLMAGSMLTLALAGCSGSDEENGGGSTEADTSWQEMDPEEIEGEITVITQRTDIVDTVFQDYEKEFQKTYPNVEVNFEALTDYGGEIMPRMNTDQYGDVLLIPVQVPIEEIPRYFEPLGELSEMEEQYRGVEERAVDGTVYGIPIAVSYTGVIYNNSVFEEAGVTELPQTPDEFLTALDRVKQNTDAIPLYTNYAAGWPLTQWQGALPTVAGDTAYYNQTMPHEKDPFSPGKPHYELYKVMYDAAEQGLIEGDPLTTDWEASKVMMNNGEIATMVLGSWALEQIQGAGENAEDIAMMPFPTNADEVFFPLGADLNIGVNKNSENKEAALAWVDWYINDSGYAVEQAGGISASYEVELPEDLAALEEQGIQFLLQDPAKEGEEGLLDEVDKESEVGLWLEDRKKVLIEAAIGNRDETFDELMEQWNEDWNAAVDEVAANQ
ncbi:ABC transporter substrate-binding protein [Jeotgalibacillus sp. ET6]|uniref:ABC transporter substrate-binding protein n=1 Tax=Jeotgalibacillus sp. ET6 TaxID=3037260 RepID=UPI002418418D|nr:ABC transporter substrate-binding protein [Jeotgalibacillus sp. ET6]MDG5471531.1 ABC transporter substrate-binding protein [Jeotgalibacillus sp. ET6]